MWFNITMQDIEIALDTFEKFMYRKCIQWNLYINFLICVCLSKHSNFFNFQLILDLNTCMDSLCHGGVKKNCLISIGWEIKKLERIGIFLMLQLTWANKQFVRRTNCLFTLYKLEVRPIFSTPSHGPNSNISIHLEAQNCKRSNKISSSLFGRGKSDKIK